MPISARRAESCWPISFSVCLIRNELTKQSLACFAPLATTNGTSLLKRGLQSSSGKRTRLLTRDANSRRRFNESPEVTGLGYFHFVSLCVIPESLLNFHRLKSRNPTNGSWLDVSDPPYGPSG